MDTISLSIKEIELNPWHFRLMSEKDFEMLTQAVKENGIEMMPQPVVAKINKKFYLVDGHARLNAA
ncbi:MAG: ParB N-terminal domain-containing protein, partial [Candidatus Nitrosotenuis sp.]